MEPRRTLAIFLDGYEESLERRFTKDGLLPNLGRLRQRSARFAASRMGGAHLKAVAPALIASAVNER